VSILLVELSIAFIKGFSGYYFKFATLVEVLMGLRFRCLRSYVRCWRKDSVSSVTMLRRIVLGERMVW
jgi:hypothetical protein